MHSDCMLFVVCQIRHNPVESSQSSFDELFHKIIYDDFTLLVNCINTTVPAEQPLHHNIILEKQDHCSVDRVNTKTAISGSHIPDLSTTERKKIDMLFAGPFSRPAKTVSSHFFSFDIENREDMLFAGPFSRPP